MVMWRVHVCPSHDVLQLVYGNYPRRPQRSRPRRRRTAPIRPPCQCLLPTHPRMSRFRGPTASSLASERHSKSSSAGATLRIQVEFEQAYKGSSPSTDSKAHHSCCCCCPMLQASPVMTEFSRMKAPIFCRAAALQAFAASAAQWSPQFSCSPVHDRPTDIRIHSKPLPSHFRYNATDFFSLMHRLRFLCSLYKPHCDSVFMPRVRHGTKEDTMHPIVLWCARSVRRAATQCMGITWPMRISHADNLHRLDAIHYKLGDYARRIVYF